MTPSPLKTLLGPGWLVVVVVVVVVLAAASVATDETIYAKVGDEVTLKTKQSSVTDATKSITWKVGNDLAVEFDEGHFKYYREFQGRSNLNNHTGEFTITDLTYNFTNVYTIEIDKPKITHKIQLFVLAPVPVPTIASSPCTEDSSTCTLTCLGDTSRKAEPVEYIWMTDNTEVLGSTGKTYTIKDNSSDVREFRCKMKNPVSEKSSKPFTNPFKAAERGPKISTGVTVLVVLLLAVILVAIGHRIKTGECFYNKSSMPWERDFWRNTKAQQPQVAAPESNGTTTPLKGQSDEETAVRYQ